LKTTCKWIIIINKGLFLKVLNIVGKLWENVTNPYQLSTWVCVDLSDGKGKLK
jgi:hypothetical protein